MIFVAFVSVDPLGAVISYIVPTTTLIFPVLMTYGVATVYLKLEALAAKVHSLFDTIESIPSYNATYFPFVPID